MLRSEPIPTGFYDRYPSTHYQNEQHMIHPTAGVHFDPGSRCAHASEPPRQSIGRVPTLFDSQNLLGGLQLEGVDLANLERADLSLQIPVRQGTHRIYTWSAVHALVQVPPETVANITMKVRPNTTGEPEVSEFKIKLSSAIKITNACHAFRRSKGKFGTWMDVLKDRPFVTVLHGAEIDSSGVVRIKGKIKFRWPFDSVDLGTFVSDKRLPKLKLKLKELLAGDILARPPSLRVFDKNWPMKALADVMSILQTGEAKVHVDTMEMTPLLYSEQGAISFARPTPVFMDFNAHVTPRADYTVDINFERSAGKGFSLDAGELSAEAHGQISINPITQCSTGTLRCELIPRSLVAQLARQYPINHFRLAGEQKMCVAATFRRDNGKIFVQEGLASFNLGLALPHSLKPGMKSAEAEIQNATARIAAQVPFRSDGIQWHVDEPNVELNFSARHGTLKSNSSPIILRRPTVFDIPEQRNVYYAL